MTQIQPFEFAVREHGPRVLRVCRSLLGPGPDADDAWSETFLAALRAWPEMAQVVSMEGWLVRVAQRTCIDAIRARERRPVPTAYLPEQPSATPADGEIWRVVARLPEQQRLAVAYHYYGGLPHTETADLIGSTPAAVRRAASDGIASLRRSVGRLDPSDPSDPTERT